MPTASSRATNVVPSGIREIVHLVIERGDDILRLEIGEPDFSTPWHIVEAAHKAASTGSGYTASGGSAELRSAIRTKLRANSELDVAEDQIVVTSGGMQGCSLAFAALVTPGSEVLVPDPGYPNYGMLASLFGADAVPYPQRPDNDFVPNPEDIESLVTDRTAAICLNSPSNPTGAVFPPHVVRRIVEIAAEHDITVISDEVYDELVYEGSPANAYQYDEEHVVGVYSLSKTYAMTGWRIGYVVAPRWLAPILWVLQEPLITCVSSVVQAAAVAAVTGPQDCVAEMRAAYRSRRDLVVDFLADAGHPVRRPGGAFYVMLPLVPDTDSRLTALKLIDHGVAVAPGSAFGNRARDHLRVSLATGEETLRAGLSRIIERAPLA